MADNRLQAPKRETTLPAAPPLRAKPTGWFDRLSAALLEHARQPFAYGRSDCMTLVADAVAAQTGEDIYPVIGRADSKRAAEKELLKRGSRQPRRRARKSLRRDRNRRGSHWRYRDRAERRLLDHRRDRRRFRYRRQKRHRQRARDTRPGATRLPRRGAAAVMLLLALLIILASASPALAEPITLSIAAAVGLGGVVTAGSIAASIGTAIIGVAVSVGASLLVRTLAPKTKAEAGGRGRDDEHRRDRAHALGRPVAASRARARHPGDGRLAGLLVHERAG